MEPDPVVRIRHQPHQVRALGEGGEDGAIDVLLVGMDSRTDAHGNPLTEEELATLRAGDDEATNTDTIILIRIPNNGESATAISIPRDSYVKTPDMAKTKINGVYGEPIRDDDSSSSRSKAWIRPRPSRRRLRTVARR